MAKKNDTPERKALVEEFEQQREHMHRQMLASVSHDLKTPLAAVIGSLEIYDRMKGVLPPEKADMLLATALSEAYRLDNFVSNILDMAKIETGLVRPRREKGDLSAMLRDCVEKAGHRSKDGNVKLIPLPHPVQLETDPALLCRIVGLLLDNALKYGGTKPDVRVTGFRTPEGKVRIEVTDSGPGIPEDQLETIFSKYTRLARADHQNAGTGLGLAIGRAIAAMLPGHLAAGNRPEGGAVFTIDLHEA